MATSIVETITPAKAQEYLNKSGGNRNISTPVVTSYATSMKAGKWLLNGESITFDTNGVLLNGHHRLHAVIKAGVPIRSFVTRGVEHECFTTFDCGRHRTVGQLIGMQGIKHYNIISSSINLAIRLVNGQRIQENRSVKHMGRTNTDMIDFFNQDREFFIEIGFFCQSLASRARILDCSIVGGTLYFLVRVGCYDLDYVKDFFSQLCSLDTCDNEIIDAFRKRLIKNAASNTKLKRQVLFALLIKTWNSYVTGRKTVILKYDSERETYPKFVLNIVEERNSD